MSTVPEDLYFLYFTVDNPCNTDIFHEFSHEHLYHVVTKHEQETVTELQRANGQIVASWVWNDVKPDRITLDEGQPMSLSSWLKKSMIPFKNTAKFTHQGLTYKWKGNGPGLELQLFMKGDKENPIACFIKSHNEVDQTVTPHTTTHERARLALDHRAGLIQDLVVISFLILEKSRRPNEVSMINRANALAIPPMQ